VQSLHIHIVITVSYPSGIYEKITLYENAYSIFYADCRSELDLKDNNLPKHEKSSVLIMKLSAASAKSSGPQKGDRYPPGAARAA
jgi:hypothetical protein